MDVERKFKIPKKLMRSIKDLLTEIIPPSDYQHRNGFSNELIIDSLIETEKTHEEMVLIMSL